MTFATCLLLAIVTQPGSVVSRILISVLMANFIGVIVALVVTFVFKFPRDGTLREQNEFNEVDLP